MVGGQQQSSELYVPVAPEVAFTAMRDAVAKNFNLKSADDFTMACSFTSSASAFTWGEKFSSQVVPSGDGATIKVSGVGKVGFQVQQGSRTAKLIDRLFADITAALRPKT